MVEARRSDEHRETHSRAVPGGRGFWWTDHLWQHAEGLRPFMVRVADVREFDLNCWFGPQKEPTCRAVARHAERIYRANLSYPVILSADGGLMDGGHRLAKAWLAGQKEVAAVRFERDPEPDWIEPTAAHAQTQLAAPAPVMGSRQVSGDAGTACSWPSVVPSAASTGNSGISIGPALTQANRYLYFSGGWRIDDPDYVAPASVAFLRLDETGNFSARRDCLAHWRHGI